jgi:hypothetical protein
MHPYVAPFVALLVTAPITVLGFTVPITQTQTSQTYTSKSSSSLHAASLDVLNVAQSLWISTIDGDIDKIPENEFASVFAGGIVRYEMSLFSSVKIYSCPKPLFNILISFWLFLNKNRLS